MSTLSEDRSLTVAVLFEDAAESPVGQAPGLRRPLRPPDLGRLRAGRSTACCLRGCPTGLTFDGAVFAQPFADRYNMMQIVLNGEARQVPDGQTVLSLLEDLGLDPGRVAVELDGAIVKRPEWGRRALAPGSRLEIVHFVGGG